MIKYCSILHHSTIAQPFGRKNCFIWPFFQNCTKKYSLYTVSICIFDAKKVFFEVRFFDEFLFDSSSEHHCAPFWPKKLLHLAIFQKVDPKSTVYTLSRFAFLMPKKFFSRYDFLMNFCLILHQSTIVHLFGRKNCFIWPFFKKLIQKVQSIHCLDLHFWCQKSFLRGTIFWWIFVRFIIRAPLCTFLAEKTASFGLFSKRWSKKYSLYTVPICIFDAKKFFSRYDFLTNFCSILHESTIVHLFGRKYCFIWPFLKKLIQKVQSIHCLDLHFWCQKSFFRGSIFWWIFVRFFIRAPLCTFLPEKLLHLASFQKVDPKSTVYTLSRFAFLMPKKFFSRYDFLMNFCLILHQSTIVHLFGRKNCFIWPFFKSWSKKYSLYTVSICIFDAKKVVFRGTIFWWIFVRFFIRAPLCTFLAEKTASFGLFSTSWSKKYSLYTVSICIFDAKKVFCDGTIFWWIFVRFFIRAPLCTFLAEKTASFGHFSKSWSKKYSLYTVSICIFDAKKVLFKAWFFHEIFFDSSSEHHCAPFSGRKFASFGLFTNCCSKKYSLYTVTICIFDAKKVVFRGTIFWWNIFRFFIRAPLCTFFTEKLLFGLYWYCCYKKYSLYTVSICIFDTKKSFFRGTTFWWNFCSILHQSNIVHLFGQKNCFIWRYLSSSYSKKYSLYTVSICIFDGEKVFFEVRFVDEILFDSSSEHHCAPIWTKNCFIWPFFKKLLQKVQSINCLDLHFWCQKSFFRGTIYRWNFVRFFIRAPLCTFFAEKTASFGIVSKSWLQKVQSIHCLDFAFLMPKKVFFEVRFFDGIFVRFFIRAPLMHLFGRKNCFIWPFFNKLLQKVQSIHCLDLHFWCHKSFFRGMIYYWNFVRYFIRAPLCTFLAEKTASFGLFSKRCSKKYSLYTVSICIFDAQKVFSRYEFLMKFCSILHQSTIVHLFGRKNCFIWPFFQKCTKKYSLYTVSICIFDAKKFFRGTNFWWIFVRFFIRAPLCTFLAEKLASFGPFFKKLLQKVQSIHCLDLHFWCHKYFFEEKFVDEILFDSSSEHHCAPFSPKNCFTWPFLILLLQKVQSIHCVDLHFWCDKSFFRGTIFWWNIVGFFIRATLCTFLAEKTASFRLFSISCFKRYSLYTVSICIFDAKKVFFEVRFIDGILFDSWSDHHCAPFWPKKLLHLALSKKVALLMPKKFFSRYDSLMEYCSILDQITIVHLFGRKNCFIWHCLKKLPQNVQSIHCLELHFWCSKSFFRGTIFWWNHLRFFIKAPLCTFLAEKTASFGLFSISCSKDYSLYTISICIFDAIKVFFEVWFITGILFDTWSEHHCAPFWPKKLLHLAFFQKDAPKSTVYTLSRFAFLMPKKCILR